MTQDAEFQLVTRDESTVPVPLSGLGMLTPEMVAKAEAAVELVNKVKAICLRVTRYTDWKKLGDKAYLQASGVDKVAAQWGVSFSFDKEGVQRREEDRGGTKVVVFSVRCSAHFNGRTVEAVGVCDSEKQFYVGRDNPKPFEERDFSSMEKHAATNAKNRALKAILGFDGIPWEEVEQILGAAAQKIQSVSYGGKAEYAQPQTAGDGKAKDEMKKMLMEMANGDIDAAKQILRELTVDPTGKFKPHESVDAMTAKQAGFILNNRVKPAYAKWQEGNPMREPGEEG